MPKIDDRIATLETKLKQLKTRQARLEARKKNLASRRARKDDTRRKILVGAIVLTRVEQGQLARTELRTWLDAALTRPDDRELFNLPVGGG
jgi:chromosome segregation ATPase